MIGKTRGLWELKRLNLKGEGMVRVPGGKLGLILSGRRKEEQGGKQSVQRLYKGQKEQSTEVSAGVEGGGLWTKERN